jgi:hypothetical protein
VGVAKRSPTAIEFIPFRDGFFTLKREQSLAENVNQVFSLKAWELIAGGNAPGKLRQSSALKGSNLAKGKDELRP